ncbi:HAD family hydrolase [Paenibacillus sp. UNC451MF]|uniref:HAD family hydrolase n=1 Tax=Paenibacillus sp. UNC451MF TaxID=1449063 RepID=UPI00048E513E|nr:HAD family hydrolase [Paenibacillus sp. UNC451MF]
MGNIKAVLFDFDGTISTLRAGWEEIMRPLMKEAIAGQMQLTVEQETALEHEIDAYIDQSTGIQTIYQMRWLAEAVRQQGWNHNVLDEWEYKAEYNKRLLECVNGRIEKLQSGEWTPEQFLIRGAAAFIQELHQRGIDLYVASGTDHLDVVNEARVLGLANYFQDIMGAPVGKADCSKEKVLQQLIHNRHLAGEELAVIGDGKVEIRLGKEAGAMSLGLASDEERREGINPVKERRLRAAGADWIAGDFRNIEEWLAKLGL